MSFLQHEVLDATDQVIPSLEHNDLTILVHEVLGGSDRILIGLDSVLELRMVHCNFPSLALSPPNSAGLDIILDLTHLEFESLSFQCQHFIDWLGWQGCGTVMMVHDLGNGWQVADIETISVHDGRLNFQHYIRICLFVEMNPFLMQSLIGDRHLCLHFTFDRNHKGSLLGHGFHGLFVQLLAQGHWGFGMAVDLVVDLGIGIVSSMCLVPQTITNFDLAVLYVDCFENNRCNQ